MLVDSNVSETSLYSGMSRTLDVTDLKSDPRYYEGFGYKHAMKAAFVLWLYINSGIKNAYNVFQIFDKMFEQTRAFNSITRMLQ